MAGYNDFPEILAMLVFYPIGVFMGYMINYPQVNDLTIRIYDYVTFWPFIVGGAVAIFVALFHYIIKQNYKQYKYEHMYFSMIGLVFVFVAGILILSESDERASSYLGFVGHAICYISALSYINIRTTKSKHRYLKMSIPHLVYLIGVAIGAILVWTGNNTNYWDNWYYDDYYFYYVGETAGIMIMISSSVIFGGFLINEVLQHSMKSYNYKKSLDEDINRENNSKEIFNNKYFHITPPHLNFPTNMPLPQIPLPAQSSNAKQFGLILYALASKILTVMAFYYPFLFIHMIASATDFDLNIFVIHLFGIGGILISLVVLALLGFKVTYLLSIGIKILFMAVLLIYFSFDYIYFTDIKVIFWVVWIGMGFGFSSPDLNILSYTNLKCNEIILALGYFIELCIVGVLQHETIFNTNNIFDGTSNFYLIFAHALTFILILLFLGMLGIFAIPNGKHMSLLEIQNILNKCKNINQLVNTGNYNGQQHPHMYMQQNYPQIAQIQPQVPPQPYDPNNSAYRTQYPPMFMYGQQNPNQPQHYPQQQPNQPQYYQQTPYMNTTYPSQQLNQMNDASSGQPGTAPNNPSIPPQNPQQQPNQPQHYQQTPYINTTYPSQHPHQMNNAQPGQSYNPNIPPQNYIHPHPAVAMPPQNIQNLPPNMAPLMDNTYQSPLNHTQHT